MQNKSRIKFENGEVKFIDPIDPDFSGNGIIIFFNDIQDSTLNNKPLRGSLSINKNDDLLESDIRDLREETTNQLEKKFKNWNM